MQGAFAMVYGELALDAALRRIPLVGFLPGDDRRVVGTIDAIAEQLGEFPALHRYDTRVVDDGIDEGEGAFLLCSFEMVSALVCSPVGSRSLGAAPSGSSSTPVHRARWPHGERGP